jgi:hypothetical protein
VLLGYGILLSCSQGNSQQPTAHENCHQNIRGSDLPNIVWIAEMDKYNRQPDLAPATYDLCVY